MLITITRLEGPHDECRQRSFGTFQEADKTLRHWSMTAPADGSFHRCEYLIEDERQHLSLKGQYDLKHWRVECANLRAHVVGSLEFLAAPDPGKAPYAARYAALVQHYSDAVRHNARKLADFFSRA